MKKAVRICCFALGTALLLAALFLVLHNVAEDKKGGEQAELLLDNLKHEIPQEIPETETMQTAEDFDLYAEYETETVPEMETTQINGNAYIGYIAIPALDVELPVLSEWSYPNLKISPCRFVGTVYAHDMIVCAHNYDRHFGLIKTLKEGDRVSFTDVYGDRFNYEVSEVTVLQPTDVEEMTDPVDWDLTLFTCTIGGATRVTVRCVMTGSEPAQWTGTAKEDMSRKIAEIQNQSETAKQSEAASS